MGALAIGLSLGCRAPQPESPTPPDLPPPPLERPGASQPAIPLGFVETDFGAAGAVTIGSDALLLEPGVPLSGVTFTGATPTPPYTLEVAFTKRYGSDFPLAVTFPVAGSHLSLVLGGWGGTVCGLSSLDGLDAARNTTRFVRAFPAGVRTEVVLTVDPERVQVALDGAAVLDVDLAGRAVGVRAELEPCQPLGLAAFATATTVHRFRIVPR